MTYPLTLQPLCEVQAYLATPVVIGSASRGIRIIFPVEKGTVRGTAIKGILKPFGADWALIRHDNCLELDVRILIETDDAALIHTYYTGIIDMTEQQVATFLGGGLPNNLLIHVTPRFETSHERYQWLNRIQAVGAGSVEVVDGQMRVSYSWYQLT